MSSSALDLSEADDFTTGQLEETERRLVEAKKRREEQQRKAEKKAELDAQEPMQNVGEDHSTDDTPKSKKRKKKSDVLTLLIRREEKPKRTSLTMKVRDDNAERFHHLYNRLQSFGDTRDKQELADEAMEMLFKRYQAALE